VKPAVIRCRNPKGYHRKAPILGEVTPGDGYGQLFLYCRKCKAWTPNEPPADTSHLEEIRCQRGEGQNVARELFVKVPVSPGHVQMVRRADLPTELDVPPQDTKHGELLALVALQPGSQLIIRCQQNRNIVNSAAGTKSGVRRWFRDERPTPLVDKALTR
jgi:hypothetical protein